MAVLFMVMDHCGKLFFPAVPEMRLLGRIAFPLFAWGIVIGCEYTKDIRKYALRILLDEELGDTSGNNPAGQTSGKAKGGRKP